MIEALQESVRQNRKGDKVMNELKAIRSGEIYNIIEYEDCYRTDDLYYPKSEVDAAIEELMAENRKLKRALWLARAWGANQRTKYLDFFLTGRAHAIRKYKWIKITFKCRAKAEEYK